MPVFHQVLHQKKTNYSTQAAKTWLENLFSCFIFYIQVYEGLWMTAKHSVTIITVFLYVNFSKSKSKVSWRLFSKRLIAIKIFILCPYLHKSVDTHLHAHYYRTCNHVCLHALMQINMHACAHTCTHTHAHTHTRPVSLIGIGNIVSLSYY